MTGEPPAHADRLARQRLDAGVRDARGAPQRAVHRAGRQCPSIAPEWEDPAGVPISAIMFGGRRATVVPLVHEARDWEHGVFMGSIMSLGDDRRRKPAQVGKLRFDPMAMLPFCGYHMGDYFAHWLTRRRARRTPSCRRIFYVNWFRKDEDGKFLWPGFGENSRVLAWIFGRVNGDSEAVETSIGFVPSADERGIDRTDLDVSEDTMARLLEVDTEGWLAQLPQMKEHLRRVRREAPGCASRAARSTRAAVEELPMKGRLRVRRCVPSGGVPRLHPVRRLRARRAGGDGRRAPARGG